MNINEILKNIKTKDRIYIKNISDEIKNIIIKINNSKEGIVNFLIDNNIDASINESLSSLVNKLSDIELGGGGSSENLPFFVESYLNTEEMFSGNKKTTDTRGVLKKDVGSDIEDEEFPLFKNLRYINNFAFHDSIFIGNFPKLDNLENVGDYAFGFSEFSGTLPQLNSLKYVGTGAFNQSGFSGTFPQLNSLEYLGKYAFRDSKFTGTFPQLNTLEYLGESAFEGSEFSGTFPNMEKLSRIEHYSLGKLPKFSGEFPKLENLQYIDDYVFTTSSFTGKFPQMNSLEYIGDGNFGTISTFSGTFPQLNSLKYIGQGAFAMCSFSGVFPKLENIEHIGPGAFFNSNFSDTSNIPGWDGSSEWNKLSKVMNRNMTQLSLVPLPQNMMNEYIEEKEPEDIEEDLKYYKEYKKRLEEEGFKEYRNSMISWEKDAQIVFPFHVSKLFNNNNNNNMNQYF